MIETLKADAVLSCDFPPLRTALIGCGAISRQMHLPVLAGHTGFDLTCLVDRDLARAEEFAAGYGVKQVFGDVSELDASLIDAAVIATPPAFHADCAIELMRKGIHLLVEKPIALTTADAQRMVAVARETGCALSVGYFRRLFPSVRLLKGLLDADWAGRPLSFTVAGGGMYNWSAATLANMRRETAGGGVLMDFGTHLVDLLFALFDEPAEVVDYRDNSRGGIEADCNIDLVVHHRDSPLKGRAEFARLRELGSYIRVECERATLEYQLTDRYRIKVTPRDLSLVDFRDGSKRGIEFDAGWSGQASDEDWYATFAAEYDDWRQAIISGQPPVLSGESVLPTMRVIDTCYSRPGPIDEPWVDGGMAARPPILTGLKVSGRAPRVLVTGASGFIGCRVAEVLRLHEGFEVRAVVNNPGNAARLSRLDVEMVQADLGSGESLSALVEGCDAVIHCAVGTAYGEPHKIKRVTVDSTRALAEAALTVGVDRFVHLSSMSVYGTDDDVPSLIEESYQGRARKSTNYYGWTKWLAEQSLSRLARRGLPVVILRPGRVFGPFGGTFVVNPLRAIAEGRFAWGGDPDAPSDMVYVDNVVAACLRAWRGDLSRVDGQAFNISDRDAGSWRQFYTALGEQLGFDLTDIPVKPRQIPASASAVARGLALPAEAVRGAVKIVTSTEFKSLGQRILATKPIGTIPRSMIDRSPWIERGVRKLVRADDSLPVWTPMKAKQGGLVAMGSAGAKLDLSKAEQLLGYESPVPQEEAVKLTAAWARHARVVQP